jgi:NADH-quinone oxidoreductase subunit E
MNTLETRFEQLKAEYPARMRASLVLPLLQIVQEERGYVTAQDALVVAEHAGVPAIQVMEALSWYTMLFRRPMGRHVIKVCRNISCSLRGAERMLDHLQRQLGVAAGETTPDGRFTLLTVECLASCGTAPVMQIDSTHHDGLSEPRIDAILKDLA